MRINFDFLDLGTFLVVIQTGFFHRAAEQLHTAQPSATRRIRKLEEALGSAFSEQTIRSVHPTLAAKRLQTTAEAMSVNARETTRALRDDRQAHAYQRARAGRIGIRVPDLTANDVA